MHPYENYDPREYQVMITAGSTIPTSYIPHGYKLPLTVTSGETENLWDETLIQGVYILSNGVYSYATDNYICNANKIAVSPSTQYTFKIFDKKRLTGLSVLYYNSSETYLKDYVTEATNPKQLTFTTPAGCSFICIDMASSDGIVPNDINMCTLTKGSTVPDHYIPHRHTSDIPIYIGDTQLMDEEYVDYAEQKVWKRTNNLFNKNAKDTNNGYVANKYLKSTGEETSDASDAISEYIPIKSNTTYKTLYADTTIRYTRPSVCFYDVNKVYISGTAYSNSNPKSFSTPSDAVYIRLTYRQAYINIVTLYEGADSDPTVYQPYLQPTDPPAPFPEITTFEGENTVDADTTVQPEKLDITYRNWDALRYPYVRSGGEWTRGPDTLIYGWHVDPSISDPSNAVTYLADAVGKTPAAMGSSTFSYGDWADAFFMPKPCMLKYDGTVDYYLDPNDYAKKADGTASDVANSSYDGNAMMEWPLIWYKFEAGTAEGECYFYCSDRQVNESYKCWCNINSENEITEHFYTSIYNGTGTSKLRSLSGVQLTSSSGCGNTTVSDEVSAATANNTTSDVEWYTEVYSDRALISSLMILIGKTLDDKSTFGNGMLAGSITAKEAYVTGSLDAAGLFYGDVTSQTAPVKIFGMENWYGCVWHRVAGLSAGTGSTYQYKLTYGTADGSTAVGYNASANGYISSNVTRPTSSNKQGLIVKMTAGVHGLLPSAIGGDPNSIYYCSMLFSDSGNYAVYGGNAVSSISGGSQSLGIGGSSDATWWGYAASLSCKPISQS
jgi:hypothetical protein